MSGVEQPCTPGGLSRLESPYASLIRESNVVGLRPRISAAPLQPTKTLSWYELWTKGRLVPSENPLELCQALYYELNTENSFHVMPCGVTHLSQGYGA